MNTNEHDFKQAGEVRGPRSGSDRQDWEHRPLGARMGIADGGLESAILNFKKGQ